MADGARSSDPAVQAQLDRLDRLSPGADVLGLERITALLGRLGNPEGRLPPVFHIAGTNGKGSTTAFLRAMLEAAGYRVHAYTSPHLVRFNERIRLAGTLITDADLAATLARVLDVAEDIGASFFEVTTTAALLRFAEEPADACVIEVGLGGRLDATNALPAPLVCGIASLGIDHEAFLLAPEDGVPSAPLDRIGFEKAGIAKAGVPLVTQSYPLSVEAVIAGVAARVGADFRPRGVYWDAKRRGETLHFRDLGGELDLPVPTMPGAHQADNAALAVAMLRAQDRMAVPETALAAGIRAARWPARLQRLGAGPLTAQLPGTPIWLDGGHNADAGAMLGRHFRSGTRLHVIAGVLRNKDASGLLSPLVPVMASFTGVPVPGHEYHEPRDVAHWLQSRQGITFAGPADHVAHALEQLATSGLVRAGDAVLICGSLYLAGEVLRANGDLPD